MSHRLALRRNLVQSLIEHGEVRTTLPKAKEVRAFAERLVTLAIDGSLAARQRAIALLNDRAIIPAEHRAAYDGLSDAKRAKVLYSRSGRRYRASTTRPGVKFTAESVIHRLFADIGPRMKQRNEARSCSGGYTRIIKLADRRLGDGGSLAILQWVGPDDAPRGKGSDKTERKRRARVKYAFFAGKPLKRRGARRRPAKAKPTASDGE
jgi:large subunit ribosomal protein L17